MDEKTRNETPPCIWRKVGFSYYPDCLERDGMSRNWQSGAVKEFTYCPYCGRRITTASTRKKMKLIIDGNNLLCSAYFVTKNMPDETRIKGTVSLFYTMMEKLRTDFHVKKLYIAWDGKDGTKWRKEILPEYKANRKHNPQLRKCINKAKKKWIGDKYIHIEKLDAEADDIIYALCRILKGKIIIVSSDKDFIQVVQEGLAAKLYNNITKSYREIPEIDSVIEKAICGDSSDNLKGVHHCGPAFVKKYINGQFNFNNEDAVVFAKHLKVIGLKNNPHKDDLLNWVKEYLYAMEVGF